MINKKNYDKIVNKLSLPKLDEMREATKKETKKIREYISKNSKPTGINFFDLIDDKYVNLEERLNILKEMIETQGKDGNWNYDPYMHGMYNGMILSLSIIEGNEPNYKKAPEKWIRDEEESGLI